MAKKITQFNFKLPEDLLKQLKSLADAKGVTATELVIQGIRHVLGFKPDSLQAGGIDSQLYQQLDKIEQRIQDLTDYQSAVDIETDKRIKALEETVEALRVKLLIPDISEDKDSSSKADSLSIQNIGTSLDDSPGDQRGEIAIADSEVDINLDTNLEDQSDKSTEPPKVQKTLSEITQLELVNLDNLNAAKTVDSTEILAALRAEDPQGGWNNELLTTYRRNKSRKDKWHDVGALRFKYLEESKDAAKSRKNTHLWQIIRLNRI